ncbi:cytochrome P450 [Bdellovibrio sp. HCB117]|uniref:cytochrome P450 n=1 Tax=Bdellovibrio sp. HCB117 TaxID=3394359 RepID=UPI0039B500AB
MDGKKHLHRKKMFLSFMTAPSIQNLLQISERHWMKALRNWQGQKTVLLFEQSQLILTMSACEWTGVPLKHSELAEKAELLRSMFDDAGSVSARHFRARARRKQAESWMSALIAEIREGKLKVPKDSALYVVANFKEEDGNLLPLKIAAVELLNLLRPTVAVSVFILFVAHALHYFPGNRTKISEDSSYADFFIQEVRRFYPFFPAIAAIAAKNLRWNNVTIPQGARVLLDLNGINHDPILWHNPESFYPDRFKKWDGSLYNFVPQGGGFQETNHRCPGEWITRELMKQAATIFSKEILYRVPEQDLTLRLSRMPPIPSSHFVISDVQYKPKTQSDLRDFRTI